MRFKLKSTEVEISFTFFAILLLFIVLNKTRIYILSLVASGLHEAIHILFIKLFGGNIKRIALNFFGGEIQRDTARFSNCKEALINASAPFFNLFIGVILIFFFGSDCLFGLINLFLGTFNILPFHSFDGGRALYEIITIKVNERTAGALMTFLSVTVTVCFSFLSVYVFLNYNKNFMLISMSFFLLFSVISDIIKTKKICKDL